MVRRWDPHYRPRLTIPTLATATGSLPTAQATDILPTDFDKPVATGSTGEVTAPAPVVSGGPGTLGWYYSSENSQEPLTPVTKYPYGRSWAEPGPNSKVTKTSGPGDQFHMGNAPSETKQQLFKRSDLANYYALQPNFTLTSAGLNPTLSPALPMAVPPWALQRTVTLRWPPLPRMAKPMYRSRQARQIPRAPGP